MSHFDEIAEEYREQIPEHMRQHYLVKKTRRIMDGLRGLSKRKDELVGLDLGCGLGWYAQELRQQGHPNTIGLDASKNEIGIARAGDKALSFMVGTAESLPFKEESFDFIYSINMFHHLSKDVQRAAFREVERVLAPNGHLFLHEINLHNPLFRLYMRHIFPRRKKYDTGEEEWVPTGKLAELCRLKLVSIDYFTFTPDFAPEFLFPILRRIESALEQTPLAKHGIHYMATFRRVR